MGSISRSLRGRGNVPCFNNILGTFISAFCTILSLLSSRY